MTLKELSQLYYLNKEIEADIQRLERLRANTYKPSSPNLSGMPKSQYVDNALECGVAEIADLEEIISDKLKRIIQERKKLEMYISSIHDSLTRQVFTLRFINNMSWLQVALKIGGGNTEDSVKKVCYRYIKGTKKEKK